MSERGARSLAGFLLLVSACSAHDSPRSVMSQPFAADVYLDEDFAVPEGRCRVVSADERLTELDEDAAQGKVARDVRVLRVQLTCTAEGGFALEPSAALKSTASITLELHDVPPISPTLRTKLNREDREAYVFPVPRPTFGGSPVRRYATTNGAALGGPLTRAALVVAGEDRAQRVHLFPRHQTDDLYARLDRLAQELCDPAATPLSSLPPELKKAHERVRTTYAPRVLALTALSATADEARVRLSYEGITRLTAEPQPLFMELRLGPGAALSFPPGALANLTRRVECAEETAALWARAQAGARAEGEPCNVAGVLVATPCPKLEADFMAPFVAHAERCAEPALPPEAFVPEDFQLTLRRGHGPSALDRDPRFTLSLFASGAVVFHGTHWVFSRDRRDGRTGARFLAAIWSRARELDFFDRRGGEWDEDACSPETDEGHLLTLRGQGRERMVLDRDGCRGPFSKFELTELMSLAERAAAVFVWTTASAPELDSHAQVWTVSDD